MIIIHEGSRTIKIIDSTASSEEDLAKDMVDWKFQSEKSKAISEAKSMEMFGMTNEQLYQKILEALKSTPKEKQKTLSEEFLSKKEDTSTEEDSIVIPERVDYMREVALPIPKVWSEQTLTEYENIMTADRKELLPKLLFQHSVLKDKSSQEAVYLEEAILRLGWIPGIPYDSMSKYRANRLLEAAQDKYDIIDTTSEDDAPTSIDTNDKLQPVYIVLVEGISIFSKAVKKYTNGPFSHAALCIDNTFEKMYSFNMHDSDGKFGGLTHEKVKEYPPDSKLGVFSIFVKKKDMQKIKDTLNMYDKHVKDTTYSILNVFTLTMNKSLQMDFSMICSQFVDNVLKELNIEIVSKPSPLVTPNDFYVASKKNKKIYKLYEGKVKNFTARKVVNKISAIKKSYIKEAAMLEADLPVQFSKDGDLLIKHIGSIDYEDEIAKSKRLMKIYYKEDNRDGLKYEIAKMWFIGNLINKDIERGKLPKTYPAKSHAYNLHQTYLKLLLQREKNFNFMEYYENTPFAEQTTRIKADTLKYTLALLKDALVG